MAPQKRSTAKADETSPQVADGTAHPTPMSDDPSLTPKQAEAQAALRQENAAAADRAAVSPASPGRAGTRGGKDAKP